MRATNEAAPVAGLPLGRQGGAQQAQARPGAASASRSARAGTHVEGDALVSDVDDLVLEVDADRGDVARRELVRGVAEDEAGLAHTCKARPMGEGRTGWGAAAAGGLARPWARRAAAETRSAPRVQPFAGGAGPGSLARARSRTRSAGRAELGSRPAHPGRRTPCGGLAERGGSRGARRPASALQPVPRPASSPLLPMVSSFTGVVRVSSAAAMAVWSAGVGIPESARRGTSASARCDAAFFVARPTAAAGSAR